ncbi:hypothetical protein BGW36DRAFT_406166 [Talaromyces proteolyticus]|uniref:Uncharacterized protein n=1 Tax=Talaromyces proteolyticus TaxID=1131652 RepID=A0AAD4Q353_9EURO|nr:uncharacterized protein BGW36DRAFT_406166 [Talaromyces proteolyticus]KAH8701048.1 hypothetical protein BGW36DRAFT_406166 [Talaromyces proteolyticus]
MTEQIPPYFNCFEGMPIEYDGSYSSLGSVMSPHNYHQNSFTPLATSYNDQVASYSYQLPETGNDLLPISQHCFSSSDHTSPYNPYQMQSQAHYPPRLMLSQAFPQAAPQSAMETRYQQLGNDSFVDTASGFVPQCNVLQGNVLRECQPAEFDEYPEYNEFNGLREQSINSFSSGIVGFQRQSANMLGQEQTISPSALHKSPLDLPPQAQVKRVRASPPQAKPVVVSHQMMVAKSNTLPKHAVASLPQYHQFQYYQSQFQLQHPQQHPQQHQLQHRRLHSMQVPDTFNNSYQALTVQPTQPVQPVQRAQPVIKNEESDDDDDDDSLDIDLANSGLPVLNNVTVNNGARKSVFPPIPTLAAHPFLQTRRNEIIIEVASALGQRLAQVYFLSEKDQQNAFLRIAKDFGCSYSEIKLMGPLTEPDSTLRGRYRTLKLSPELRVRLLMRAVELYREVLKAPKRPRARRGSSTSSATLTDAEGNEVKIMWKHVQEFIIREGGSYKFSYKSCKKKYFEVIAAQSG